MSTAAAPPRAFASWIVLAFGLIAFHAVAAESATSEWVHKGSDGKLVYKQTPAGDRIMDFSYAGYMGGGVPLPTVPVRKTIKPSGEGDDTALIQAAINEVSALPLKKGFRGAVLLAPGVFNCSNQIVISASGVALRGSGSSGKKRSTIRMSGARHNAIAVRGGGGRGQGGGRSQNRENESNTVQTVISDPYVPSGAISFEVADASGFAVGDSIEIRHPVTTAWVKLLGMDDMKRDGRPQTWISAGSTIETFRTIAKIAGRKITLDVPLSDSFDSKFLNPPGTSVVKVEPPARLTQVGIEDLHIECPPQAVNHSQQLYSAVRMNGQDCWMRDVVIDETMNSVAVGGCRITLQRVAVNRVARHLGASKPAEFAPNAGQLLLDRCSSTGDNIWFAATGGRQAGPIVMLNCSFSGNGHIEGHQRWTTGMLLDNCRLPEGGVDFKNRGSMGSGHGWGLGWGVAWNCVAKTYVVQQPPGAFNWAIGCVGESIPMARPFGSEPKLPEGIFDSRGKPVYPQSLYLTQLAERLGPKALKNIGYASAEDLSVDKPALVKPKSQAQADKILGRDFAFHQPVDTGNMRGGSPQFSGEKAVDGNDQTYWATDDNAARATILLDMDGPTEVNAIALEEAAGLTGQVTEYKVEAQVNSAWKLLSQGTTIGANKVDRFPAVTVWKVRLTILKAQPYAAIRRFGLYLDKVSPPENFKPVAQKSM